MQERCSICQATKAFRIIPSMNWIDSKYVFTWRVNFQLEENLYEINWIASDFRGIRKTNLRKMFGIWGFSTYYVGTNVQITLASNLFTHLCPPVSTEPCIMSLRENKSWNGWLQFIFSYPSLRPGPPIFETPVDHCAININATHSFYTGGPTLRSAFIWEWVITTKQVLNLSWHIAFAGYRAVLCPARHAEWDKEPLMRICQGQLHSCHWREGLRESRHISHNFF